MHDPKAILEMVLSVAMALRVIICCVTTSAGQTGYRERFWHIRTASVVGEVAAVFVVLVCLFERGDGETHGDGGEKKGKKRENGAEGVFLLSWENGEFWVRLILPAGCDTRERLRL